MIGKAQGITEPFYVSYSEPATSESQGYITVMITYGDGHYWPVTFFWSCYAVADGVESPCMAMVQLTHNSLNFNIFGATNKADSGVYSLFYINEANKFGWVTTSSSSDYTWDFGSGRVVGWQAKGNLAKVNSTVSNSRFDLYYGAENSTVLLGDIMTQLTTMKNIDNSILETVKNIYNSVDTVEAKLQTIANYLSSQVNQATITNAKLEALLSKADDMLKEQKEANSWLKKIFEWLNESKEQEKQEVQTQGSSSVSQGSDSIENSGQGFGDSLGGLVSSMSYSGTECSWTFPQVKLPRIEGVMDEVVLIEEQKIDFGMWIDAIPSNILLLIRSVLTGALIIYCFKELYGTISYVLTLKGSGVNE